MALSDSNVQVSSGAGLNVLTQLDSTRGGHRQEIVIYGPDGNPIFRAEDSASADGQYGLPILAVRQDTPASSTGTDGDYTFAKSDSVGRLYTNQGFQAVAGGRTLLQASISLASTTLTTIVAAVASKEIRVCSLSVACAAAVTVQWQSDATAITGAMPFGANGGESKSVPPPSWILRTNAGEALKLQLGTTSIQVSGYLTYYTE